MAEIEHLVFPRQALEHAVTLLAPRGLLFVSTPSMDTAAWKALDAQQARLHATQSIAGLASLSMFILKV